MIRRNEWFVVGRGVLSPVEVAVESADDWLVARRRHALSAAAAALGRRTSVISGRSAAIVHGLPTLYVPVAPELTAGLATLGHRDWGARIRRDAVRLRGDDLVRRPGHHGGPDAR